MIGTYPLPAVMIIYATETLLMLIFFLFVTGRLSGKGLWRRRPTHQQPSNTLPPNEPVQQPQPAHS